MKIWLGILLGVLVIIAVLQIVQISALSGIDVTASLSEVAKAGVSAPAPSGGMVGGC